MVQHHRLHEGQQGEDRGHHHQGAQHAPGSDRPRLLIEMGLLREIPDDKVMFTTQFVPVKAGF